MKKLFTLFCLVALVGAAFAQTNYRPVDASVISNLKPAPPVTKKATNISSSRAASTNLLLDYDGNDDQYATDNGYVYNRYIWGLNSKFSNTDNFNLDYAAVYYDTLQYVDVNSNNAITFIPASSATLTLDSFDIFFIHDHKTGVNNFDTIHLTVFNTNAAVVTGYSTPAATFTTPVIWDTVISTNSTIPLNATNFTILTFFPNVSFPQGESFGIRVDYKADTANTFNILAGMRDECADACQAELSKAGNNSAYYLNLTQDGTPPSNFSGYYENLGNGNAIFYDCDQSGGYTIGGCENFAIQNIVMPAYVTANVNYGAVITADSLKGCPGATLNLNANAFGSNNTPFTYNWATTNGTITDPSAAQTQLVIGNSNAVVTVIVTDANSITTTATVSVASKGITVNITNANPLTINCGANATLITNLTGSSSTTGKNYTWSTGATGTGTSTIQVNTPGTYRVTVTNNSGCSASASVVVQYPGVTNTVSFTKPSPLCEDVPLTFTNTTVQLNGWSSVWSFGDSQQSFLTNGTNTYQNPGVYTVTLTVDSAGCSFPYSSSVTVLAASNAACVNGIEDVTFANAINLLPNPTNGNVSVMVNGVEKNISIKVYNVIGSEVKTFNASDVSSTFTKTFDFSDLANGTYLVKIQSADKTAIKRLTISK